MIGLEAGLTPQQQTEAQANFRFGMQLGADQTKQAVAAQNALQQVQMQNEAEFKRQAALRDMINQQRSQELKDKADLTRESTDKKFTEDTLKYGIGGLERGQSSFARLYGKVLSSPEKYTDESIDSVSKFFSGYDSIIGQAAVDLAGTPAGKIPDFTPYKSQIGSLPVPKLQLRDSYEANTESKTAKNNRWVPGGKGKAGTPPDDPTDINADWSYAIGNVDYADSALDSKQKTIDQLEKSAAEGKGVDPFLVERKAAAAAHSEANNYGATARSWYLAKGSPAQKKMISGLMQQGIVPFDANYKDKVGTWLGDQANKAVSTGRMQPDDEESNNMSVLLTGKPLGFWMGSSVPVQTTTGDPNTDAMRSQSRNIQGGSPSSTGMSSDADRGAALRQSLSPVGN